MGQAEWKLFHVLAVVLFLGNLVTCLFWAAHANRSRDPSVIAHTFGGIRRADRWFTFPGALALLVGGVAASIRGHLDIFGTGWVLWAMGLLGIGLVVLSTVRAALQRDVEELAVAGDAEHLSWKEYELLYGYWWMASLVAIAAPLLAVVLMVYRPPLPGF